MRELCIIVAEANPGDAIFRSNHASNYLPIGGRLPRDRDAILELIDTALSGDMPLRAESSRGLWPQCRRATHNYRIVRSIRGRA